MFTLAARALNLGRRGTPPVMMTVRSFIVRAAAAGAVVFALGLAPASAQIPPSIPAVDAPELAPLGAEAVGFSSLTLTEPNQADPLAYSPTAPTLPLKDRVLPVDVWYPAEGASGMTPATYSGALTGQDGKDVAFVTPGLATEGIRPKAGAYPLVILAHGYGGTPAAMTWLAENLASKGYVVVAPHFNDPPYGVKEGFAGPLARRPLDIAFVAAQAQAHAQAHDGVFASADPTRTVLIGYSMGGYGALAAAGGRLSPSLGSATHGVLAPFVSGAARAGELKVADVVALVAISPAGLLSPAQPTGAIDLAGVTAPTMFIAGSQDAVVGYEPGIKTLWAHTLHAPRYLLTFVNGGHSIGMNPAPPTMRSRLWDQDWFEDPVWRKERVIGIELHFITAFLDRYAKGDRAKGAFLAVPSPNSNDGVWPDKDGESYSAFSPGTPPSTVWKGFQRAHSAGLELRFAPAE